MAAIPTEPARYTDAPAMLLAGIRREVPVADAMDLIQKQWTELFPMLPLAGQRGTALYGATARHSGDRFDYLCGVEVESFDSLFESTARLRVPAAHYGVFVQTGPIRTIGDTWAAVMRWMSTSGAVDGETPCFERYDERHQRATGEGGFEIWVPVIPAG